LLSPTIEPSERLKDGADLALLKSGPGRKAELAFNVVATEEEDASGMIPVATGTTRLLKIVL